jgi:hypothetical protein
MSYGIFRHHELVTLVGKANAFAGEAEAHAELALLQRRIMNSLTKRFGEDRARAISEHGWSVEPIDGA